MAIRKNKVVSYYGPESAQRGDIKYWDSVIEEWVVLHIGSEGDILYANGPGFPPYWDAKNDILDGEEPVVDGGDPIIDTPTTFVCGRG
jgi:hypothetical protein